MSLRHHQLANFLLTTGGKSTSPVPSRLSLSPKNCIRNSTRRLASLLSLALLKETHPRGKVYGFGAAVLQIYFCRGLRLSSRLHITHSDRCRERCRLYKYEPSVSVNPSMTICLNHFLPSSLLDASSTRGTTSCNAVCPSALRKIGCD